MTAEYGAEATVVTEKAGRYLVQLCKHFGHKVTAEWTETTGHVAFAPGTCHMVAADGRLTVTCASASDEGLAQIKSIVEDHLTRFAWKEGLTLEWRQDDQR